MKIYKAVHERENKCKELHKEMNLNVGPTRLVQPDFYLLVDVDDIQRQISMITSCQTTISIGKTVELKQGIHRISS